MKMPIPETRRATVTTATGKNRSESNRFESKVHSRVDRQVAAHCCALVAKDRPTVGAIHSEHPTLKIGRKCWILCMHALLTNLLQRHFFTCLQNG